MSQYEYSPWQWFFHGLRSSWKQPFCDVTDRPLDTTKVSSTEEIDPAAWGPNRDDLIALPKEFRQGQNEGGRAMQRAHPLRTVRWQINDARLGSYSVDIPAALSGHYWVEKNPRPLWQMQVANGFNPAQYDRHVVVIEDDGTSHELIGVSNFGAWRAAGYGCWNADGELIHGRPVVWGGTSMAQRFLNRFDPPHRLSFSLRGRDTDEPSFPWKGEWLALNPDRVPVDLTQEQRWLADMLVTYGMVVSDHGGHTNISEVDGAQWKGIDWGPLNYLTLQDFLRAA